MDPKKREVGHRAIEAIGQAIGFLRDDFADGRFDDAEALLDEIVADAGRLQLVLDSRAEDSVKEVP